MARQRAVDIDTQQPLRLGPAKRAFRILEIGDQRCRSFHQGLGL
jgi:hypothetical protein